VNLSVGLRSESFLFCGLAGLIKLVLLPGIPRSVASCSTEGIRGQKRYGAQQVSSFFRCALLRYIALVRPDGVRWLAAFSKPR
jgi:hypothetical protein